ncbi:hypothetical protein A3I53_03355 [Candidatus Curtissbacteria bacterium RIFCSPLOWO2_02_FULL_40_13b]|uniref:Uncharacterized protein n=2 Tax=Candidatus Curtissiibacteriota TaxID=1752717 RepID=A0A1F5HSB0_9BACT|nr:MAG: hypothetical protein A2693_02185 [Candidatus Curtissbacteria bacterium RIFCSPHIGHO2_01_FULL_40_12]OGE07078.1 MAG: hypothetical protein A3I53_03355 [Candidatus Curtissbacteria bacterium RIFCSPLOWO2_02_FULL_40_13b]
MENLNHPVFKIYNSVLQLSILVFTLALVYFSFVYYPRIINQYKSGRIPAAQSVIAPVVAKAEKFPITTAAYRVVHEQVSDTYFVYVNGESLDKFVVNKNGADLTLKSVLSLESICNLDVRYSSTAKLEVPQKYLVIDNCQ